MTVLSPTWRLLFVLVLQFAKPVSSRTLRRQKEGLTLAIVNSTLSLLNDDHHGNPVVPTNALSSLTSVSDFKTISTLMIQLLVEEAEEHEGMTNVKTTTRTTTTWEIRKDKTTTTKNFFVGSTSNRHAKASLYRCKGQIVVVLHDYQKGLWYEIKPNSQGHSVVSVIADAEIARIGPAALDQAENSPWMVLLPATKKSETKKQSLQPRTTETTTTTNKKDDSVVHVPKRRSLLRAWFPSRWWSRDFHGMTMVDILVVWTHDAECAKSLLPAACDVSTMTHQNMMLAVHFFIEETNAIFRNSGLQLKLRLAGGRQVQCQETTFQRALVDLKERRIPKVQEYREEFQADVVMMLMDGTWDYPETGIAYNNYDHVDADYMYSVVAIQYTSVWYLPAHELGHNFGCSHDRGTVNMCSDMEKSNYGYRDPRGQFRTIMSYPCQARQCDDIHGLYTTNNKMDCPLIPYFSNDRSDVRYFGASLGDQANNCAAQIERVKHRVANLY